ncbi:MAG: autotransporter domain-containing protein [Verrucomicrobia bacterium]|nr:autotransporter domain-containing protein [Verrucomicrobiota bacterium]
MIKMDSKRHWAEQKRGAIHRMVAALFLCSALFSQAATNWVDGLAYGTDYSALATAGSIASVSSTNGSLIVGHESTTNLTLGHDITGFVFITNKVAGFKVDATGATVTTSKDYVFTAINATNLVITGGRFIGTVGSGGSSPPPIPGRPDPTNSTSAAMGGLLLNSTATISGAEFAGIEHTAGFTMGRSTVSISNSIFRGGDTGTGLIAHNNSMVTIQSGSFTGGVGKTAFYLQDSDATIHDGTFVGNIGGSSAVASDGLFSELTGATTNQVNLHGGTFSSLAFYGVDGSVQHFMAGTNLTVHNGIIQDGGTVVVDNQSDSALTNITVFNGTMAFPSNAFTLLDGGSFILGGQNSTAAFGNLDISADATVDVGTGQLTADRLSVQSSGSLAFGINESTNGFATLATAYFHTNATISVDAATANFGSGTNDVTLLSASSGIFMVGVSTNPASSEDFTTNNVEVVVSERSRLEDIIVLGPFLSLRFTTLTLREYWNVDGQMGDLADELDTINNPEMMAIINAIDDPALSGAITEETYFTTMNTFQTAMQGLQAALGQSVSRGAEFREELKLLPPGAKGPQRNNELRGWGKYHGQFYNHDAEGLNSAYDATLHGGVVGVDKSFGDLLLGLSGGGGNYSTTTGDDGREDIRAYHGALYGTYGTDRAYFDAGIAYGFNAVETRTSGPFVLSGEFDAEVATAYLGGGYDLIDTDGGTIFTPEASIQYSMYEQDAYSETSDNAVPRNIDAFDADSLRSSIGLNVSMLNTTALKTFGFKIDGRFHWLHEFNPEPGNMSFSLEGGSNDYQLAHPLLDEELFRAGFGVSFFNTLRQKPKNVLLRFDFDELFGDGFNSHNLSAKLIYAF